MASRASSEPPRTTPLGYRGRQILDYVQVTIERRGYAPTYAMIGDKLGMTQADVCNAVHRLERRGLLRRRSIGVRKNRGWHEPVIVLVGK